MDTIERIEKAKEAYVECQQVLKSVKILHQDLSGPYSQNDNLTGLDRSKAVIALSDADGNLSIALLHIEEAIRIITDGHNP